MIFFGILFFMILMVMNHKKSIEYWQKLDAAYLKTKGKKKEFEYTRLARTIPYIDCGIVDILGEKFKTEPYYFFIRCNVYLLGENIGYVETAQLFANHDFNNEALYNFFRGALFKDSGDTLEHHSQGWESLTFSIQNCQNLTREKFDIIIDSQELI